MISSISERGAEGGGVVLIAKRFPDERTSGVPGPRLYHFNRKDARSKHAKLQPGRLDEIFSHSLNGRRFNLLLVGVFAFAALVLAMAGVFGVLAYSVA